MHSQCNISLSKSTMDFVSLTASTLHHVRALFVLFLTLYIIYIVKGKIYRLIVRDFYFDYMYNMKRGGGD